MERCMRSGSSGPAHQRGFTYIGLLIAMAVIGLGMSIVGPLWARQTQREREAELLRIGPACARAIEHYYRLSPPGAEKLPPSVDELLQDSRFPTPIRHLRKAYTDPMQPGQPLNWLRNAKGELVGVASASHQEPLRQVAWTDGHYEIAPAAHYDEWHFLAEIPQ